MRGKHLLVVILSFVGLFLGFESRAAEWCHTFNIDLKLSSRGYEVGALQAALQKEGLLVGRLDAIFGLRTRNSVIAFQNKYKEEILASPRLVSGTGFVGKATRAKLNRLYSCQAATPVPPALPTSEATSSVNLLSPNGGEKLAQGSNYSITWNSSGLQKVTLVLINYVVGDQTVIADSVSATSSPYVWQVPYGVYSGNKYKITIKSGKTSDLSDNYFSIGAVQRSSAPSLSLVSPLGGEQWEKGKNYSIKWLFQDLDKIDTILLVNYAKNETYSLANNIGASLNAYDWFIPLFLNAVPAGNQYRVKIQSCPTAACYTDESDNYFTILAGAGASLTENRLAEIASTINRLAGQIRELLER